MDSPLWNHSRFSSNLGGHSRLVLLPAKSTLLCLATVCSDLWTDLDHRCGDPRECAAQGTLRQAQAKGCGGVWGQLGIPGCPGFWNARQRTFFPLRTLHHGVFLQCRHRFLAAFKTPCLGHVFSRTFLWRFGQCCQSDPGGAFCQRWSLGTGGAHADPFSALLFCLQTPTFRKAGLQSDACKTTTAIVFRNPVGHVCHDRALYHPQTFLPGFPEEIHSSSSGRIASATDQP